MLTHLRVRNIALIDEAEVDFEQGLNVLTGETGAGKSILLGAINLALGGRGSKDMVRDKNRPGEVDLLFQIDNKAVIDRLKELEVPFPDGDLGPDGASLLISRRFSPSGRSSCLVNDSMVTADKIRTISSYLIDIHGQHDHQSLLNPASHIDLLDRFISQIGPLKEEMQKEWTQASQLQKELDHYQETGKDRARLLSLMEFETQEIEQAHWEKDEEENLIQERRRLRASQKLKEASLEASALLEEDDQDGASPLSRIDQAAALIRGVSSYDPDFFDPYLSSLTDQYSILSDIASSLQSYGDDLEGDPGRLDQIEDRISQILHIKEKYGRTYEQVMAYYDKTKTEMDKLRNLEDTIGQLQKKKAASDAAMKSISGRMTALRTKAGARIEQEITKVLSTLQFDDPLFKVDIEPGKMSANGADKVTFLIRTNVGEEVKPLSQIASGGEMSRVMLAIKTVLAKEDQIGTMIFDEIDTGISGRTAQSVAEKMSRIALYHQVICVTHLPQIAAMADTHLRIEKSAQEGRAVTQVYPLDQGSIRQELARMLGGARITEAVLANADEMKKLADDWKAQKRREEE